ncbi:MAG: hypothetical protein R2874_09955 [Desulfobacterales bacterium]
MNSDPIPTGPGDIFSESANPDPTVYIGKIAGVFKNIFNRQGCCYGLFQTNHLSIPSAEKRQSKTSEFNCILRNGFKFSDQLRDQGALKNAQHIGHMSISKPQHRYRSLDGVLKWLLIILTILFLHGRAPQKIYQQQRLVVQKHRRHHIHGLTHIKCNIEPHLQKDDG